MNWIGGEWVESHIMEFNNFNQHWDQTMNTFNQHSQELLMNLEQKQNQDLEKLREDLDKKLPKEFKPSAEYLNLSKI